MLKIEHLAHLMIATRIKPHWGQKKEKKKKKNYVLFIWVTSFLFYLAEKCTKQSCRTPTAKNYVV